MRKMTLFIVACCLLLTACNLPSTPMAEAPTEDAVATRVAQMLTSAPTLTAPAAANPTAAPTTTAQPTAAASATSAPTATAAPSATSGPTPTTPSGAPKNSLGAPTWKDTLDGGKSFYLYDNGNTLVTLENGALVLTGQNANGWLGWSLTYSHPAQNFYIEAVFTTGTCSGADTYGLVFRAPNENAGYFYSVTCDGKYSLHARDFAKDNDSPTVEWTSSSAIHPGSNQTNRLGVMANGDKIDLYANGILMNQITDSSYTDKGNFGALIASNVTAGFTVRMEEISLWKLP